jgi:hypothetical protein
MCVCVCGTGDEPMPLHMLGKCSATEPHAPEKGLCGLSLPQKDDFILVNDDFNFRHSNLMFTKRP